MMKLFDYEMKVLGRVSELKIMEQCPGKIKFFEKSTGDVYEYIYQEELKKLMDEIDHENISFERIRNGAERWCIVRYPYEKMTIQIAVARKERELVVSRYILDHKFRIIAYVDNVHHNERMEKSNMITNKLIDYIKNEKEYRLLDITGVLKVRVIR